MKASLVSNASRVLTALPFAQALLKTPASPGLMTAAALVNAPFVRRVAPGLSGLATVGLAAVAVVSFVSSLKRKKAAKAQRPAELARSSAT